MREPKEATASPDERSQRVEPDPRHEYRRRCLGRSRDRVPTAIKHRREDVQPLRPSTARALSRFVAGRGAVESACGLPAAWRPPRALRRDLEAAGIPFSDESGRRFDFHALRGMLATRLLASGASVKAAQSLMRHSTADLTVSVYARVRDGEDREALGRLPDLLPPEPATMRATGTDGAECPLPCPFPGSSEGSSVPAGSGRSPRGGCKNPVASERMARTTGLEPATPGVTGRYSNRLSYVPALGREV
jgi:hypothetical protein